MTKIWSLLLTIALMTALAAGAQVPAMAGKDSPAQPASKQHRDGDIARHRQMAKAHEEAARCLEAGTEEKQCHLRLREACKGIGVGQYCGMRDGH